MRKNYIYYMLAVAMSASLITGVTGCSAKTTTTTTVQSESISSDSESTKNITYGQVSKVSDSSITITVGTLKDNSSSELELTDETKEVELGDSVTITRGRGGAPNGERPSGEAPSGEKPSGEASNGDRPQKQNLLISDISEGDNVSISYNEDGSVEKVTILTVKGEQSSESQSN